MSDLTGEALLESKIPIQLGELTTDLEYLDERYLSERFLYEGTCLKLSNTLRKQGVKSFTEAGFTLGLSPLEPLLTLKG